MEKKSRCVKVCTNIRMIMEQGIENPLLNEDQIDPPPLLHPNKRKLEEYVFIPPTPMMENRINISQISLRSQDPTPPTRTPDRDSVICVSNYSTPTQLVEGGDSVQGTPEDDLFNDGPQMDVRNRTRNNSSDEQPSHTIAAPNTLKRLTHNKKEVVVYAPDTPPHLTPDNIQSIAAECEARSDRDAVKWPWKRPSSSDSIIVEKDVASGTGYKRDPVVLFPHESDLMKNLYFQVSAANVSSVVFAKAHDTYLIPKHVANIKDPLSEGNYVCFTCYRVMFISESELELSRYIEHYKESAADPNSLLPENIAVVTIYDDTDEVISDSGKEEQEYSPSYTRNGRKTTPTIGYDEYCQGSYSFNQEKSKMTQREFQKPPSSMSITDFVDFIYKDHHADYEDRDEAIVPLDVSEYHSNVTHERYMCRECSEYSRLFLSTWIVRHFTTILERVSESVQTFRPSKRMRFYNS